MRSIARRIGHLESEIADHDAALKTLIDNAAPQLVAEFGIGYVTAATFYLAWSHPGRCRNEAAFARLAGAAPIEATSGQNQQRHRLCRTGVWIVVPRFGADYVWVEGSDWDLIGPVLNSLSRGPSDQVLLAPGRTLTIGYQRPTVTSSELEFFAYQDFVTQVATYLTRHLGEVNGYLATVLALISCFNADAQLVSWDRAYNCFNAGLGATANQVDLAFDQAVSSGRLNLSQGQIEAFRSDYLAAGRLKTTLTSLKKLSLGVALARLGVDSWVAAVDAGAGYVDLAGTTIINLISKPVLTTDVDAAVELTSCEGTDTSLIEGDFIPPVVCSFPWGIAEATTRLGDGPSVIVTLINTIERKQIATWWNVEDGPTASGYTVDAIGEAGVPAPTAQLLFDTLDACSECAYHNDRPPSATSGTVLSGSGVGAISFGSDAETAIETLLSQLGAPEDDTGWYDTGFDPNSQDDQCQSPTMRLLSWPNLNLVFADYDPTSDAITGRRTFVSYSHFNYDGGQSVPTLETNQGIQLGSPAAESATGQPAANVYDYGLLTRDGAWIDFDSNDTVNRISAGTELCTA